MRRLYILLLFIFIGICPQIAFAEEPYVLQAGISLEEMIPDKFLGTWRVSSNLIETNSKGYFKNNNVDLWNISRNNSVITLDNPFSGAKASISIKEVSGEKIVFEKEGRYDNKILSDTVELYLDENSFKGYNYLELKTVSEADGRLMGVQTAKYSLKGDKISGYNVMIGD